MITYTNDLKDVLDNLESIINYEFKPTPVIIEDELDINKLSKHNKYIRIWPIENEILARIPNAVYRNYIIDIWIYFNISLYQKEKIIYDTIAPQIEKLERLLDNNNTYGSGETWYNVTINTIRILMDLTEETDIEGIENIKAGNLNVTISRFCSME